MSFRIWRFTISIMGDVYKRQALEHCDYEGAYRGAHTLKGIALNLGLTPLAEKAGALTETLRNREENINIGPAFSEFKQEYENMAAVFSQLSVLAGGNAQ